MLMRSLKVLVLAVGTVACTAVGAAQTSPDEQAAVVAETQWLHLVDAGNYPDAWSSAAKLMQIAAPEPAFADAISSARKPLGALGTRSVKQVQTATQMPGAPDGTYVVAEYTTSFANKASGVETVIAIKEADGSWHVAGYLIR